MSESGRDLSIAGFLARSPAISHEQASKLLLRRLLGAALFDAASAAPGLVRRFGAHVGHSTSSISRAAG